MMSVNNALSQRPRIGILCLSAIADDPRVRRQGDLFAQKGWDVVAIGLDGARSIAPEWPCIAVDAAQDQTKLQYNQSVDKNVIISSVHQSLSQSTSFIKTLEKFVKPLFIRAKRAFHLLRLTVDQHYALTIYWTLKNQFTLLLNNKRKNRPEKWRPQLQ